MKRRYDYFLDDIIINIKRIKSFIGNLDFNSFKKDEKTIFAVIRSLEIIGEAVKQLPQELILKYPNIRWKEIKGFRNLIAHKYWSLDLDIIWDIITNELDTLKEQIDTIKKTNQ